MDVANDHATDNIITTPKPDCVLEPGGIGKTIFSRMSSYGDSIAQIDGLTGEKDTYASFLQRCVRTAISMRLRGITSADTVSICSLNHLNNTVAFIAGLLIGAKVASFDPRVSQADTVLLLKLIRPKIIFVGLEAVKLVDHSVQEAEVDVKIVVFGDSDRYSRFSEFLVESPEEKNFRPVEAASDRDTAIIFFSSGTTGRPKGICVSHFGMLNQSASVMKVGFNNSVVVSFFSTYANSSSLFMLGCILTKGCRAIVPKFDAELAWDVVQKLKVTAMFLSPSQAVALYKKGRPKGLDTTHFTSLIIGGGAMTGEQVKKLRSILPGTTVSLLYGLTEISGSALFFQRGNPEDEELLDKNPGSSGRPFPGLTYKVVDIDTEELLGPNKKGELRIRTEFQMNGYYNQDSRDTFDSEGFVKTGDIVYYDEDHCFFVVDRIKDILKYQGFQLSPTQLESVLLTHPAVGSAVVVGLPHPEDGDHAVGVVTLKDFAIGTVTAKEIEAYVDERSDDMHRLVGGVKVVDQIPITPTGKTKRNDIRDMIIRGEL